MVTSKESSNPIVFRKRPNLLHFCTPCSELPSYISTMGNRGEYKGGGRKQNPFYAPLRGHSVSRIFFLAFDVFDIVNLYLTDEKKSYYNE